MKKFGESLLVTVELIAVTHESIQVAMFAGLNHRTAGAANGVRAKAIDEQHAFVGKAIDVGRGSHILQPTFVGANGMGRMVIREDKQDIGTFYGCRGTCDSVGQYDG